ncbi:twin-arginine translocase TatA/TatE family subunit [Microcoleus sp. FACHB-831]|jgi:sec-independent protein translocase protein TatA|uniref:twin-arginine translocase TatA/TatE family subunit n=1 Tax=Microcoleus sp. FACHB-831 TaxID=2692827 RepID=UPI00168319A0|nr:twin-arginine translocase TatA/TatE family subunit [Microcoleus sp. FACHB-831]MBD1923637.1 twin-arginine translocase TatA/TatE family subunit [Microcoleus sp. FACHB-831]
MFGLGWPEVGIIAIAALVIFGPKKIPEMGSALGKTLRGFKEELGKPSEDANDENQHDK